MAAPFDVVVLSDGNSERVVASVWVDSSGRTPAHDGSATPRGVMITGSTGLFTRAENRGERHDFQYSNGSVLAPPVRSGRTFSLDVLFYNDESARSVISAIDSLETWLINAGRSLSLDFRASGNTGGARLMQISDTVFDRAELQSQDWNGQGARISLRLYFSSENP